MYFGLAGQKEKTPKQIGQEFGMTENQVKTRNTEAKLQLNMYSLSVRWLKGLLKIKKGNQKGLSKGANKWQFYILMDGL